MRLGEGLDPPLIRQQLLDIRTAMEFHFRGYDFSQVRVHTDSAAAESAKAVNAQAYTVKRNIVFGANQYTPHTNKGRELLAHELTHVVQQSANSAMSPTQQITVGNSSDPAESEADTIAQQVNSGSSVQDITHQSSGLQRQPADKTNEQVSLTSGLSIDAKLFAQMMAMCAEGKLEPIQCVKMKQAAGLLPDPSAASSRFGQKPMDLSDRPPKLPSAAEIQKILDETNKSLGAIGIGKPILPPPGWKPGSSAPPSITLGKDDDISEKNIRLVETSRDLIRFLREPGGRIEVVGIFGQIDTNNPVADISLREAAENRANKVRSTLIALGVPAASIYSSTRSVTQNSPLVGQVTINAVAKPTPAATSSSPSLDDLLSFKFQAGPFKAEVELPKSAKLKLPVALSKAKTLTFEVQAESSKTFSASISLDGLPHLRVSLKAQVKADEDKGTPGSVGLEIQTTRTVCSADNPEELKAKIKTSGEQLTKAMKELESAKPDERLGKLIDIAGAIGDMYGVIDKSKKGCKQVPSATFNFGLQGPLGDVPADKIDPDPTKRPSTYIGGSITIPF